MTEQQIKEEVIRYLKDESYNYAVLIDGEWGSGKTYFVNNSLTKAITEQEICSEKSREIKYISLYGCKSISEVQENIAWSFAENARRKIEDKANWGENAKKVSGNILLTSRKIGNCILKKFLSQDSLYEVTSDWLNLGSFIFVFDDLERCDCPINEVFGFLNELVEHERTKVIIIANEKELEETADTQYLEMQYILTLDERIEWPAKDDQYYGRNRNVNSKYISFDEMDRRRELLFPTKVSNSNYCKIREKLIGVTLKYEPDVPLIISEIIENSKYDSSTKDMLKKNIEMFDTTMQNYHHRNLRTFQFFLSKVSYLLEKLSDIDIADRYYEETCNHIIFETFSHAVKYKSNYQPPRDNHFWLSFEQETKFHSIKEYVESGTYNHNSFIYEIRNLQSELQAQIPKDDSYFLLYQEYYIHTQSWCEEQLEKIFQQLSDNYYPIMFYGKIIVLIQRLIDLGFDSAYMKRAKELMLTNISNMGEVDEISPDIWYIEDQKFKEKVSAHIIDINVAIKNHSDTASRENVMDMLKQEDWLNRLDDYINPNKVHFIQDIAVFSKAPSESWLTVLHNASPLDINSFRIWLNCLYPGNIRRDSYFEDADTMKEIVAGLKELEEEDLIKKASIEWLISQFQEIITHNEPMKEHLSENSK